MHGNWQNKQTAPNRFFSRPQVTICGNPCKPLRLLHGALEQSHLDGERQRILAGIGHSIDTMSSMLSSLLDINRLETGNLRPSKSDFAVNEIFNSAAIDLLSPLEEKGLRWRVVPSDLVVRSDKRMLEEMIRNLLSNAIRYTDRGKILLGCRRAGARFGSKSGIPASASREISCLTYLKNITAIQSEAASGWVWQSSGGWGRSWTTGSMCARRRERAPAFPSRSPGGGHMSQDLKHYQRLILAVSSSAALFLSSRTRRRYALHSIEC